MNKWVIIIVAAVLVGGFLIWLFANSTKPLPGEKTLQEGRSHISTSKLDYKFNPPTSGDHDAAWITKGFYEEPRSDGALVHSLEHGYVIVWYDCEKKAVSWGPTAVSEVYAHEDATPSASSDSSATSGMSGGSKGVATKHFEDMPKSFSNGSCDSLKSELKALYENDQHKLIIMPRINMDRRVILTAWGRTLKLDAVAKVAIKQFIDAFRDNGPEKTNEP